MVNPIGVPVGYDSAIHFSGDCQDATIALPQALILSVVPNGLMTFIMGTTFIFCIGDVDQVLASPTYEPFIQVFYNATQSKAGATIMTLIILVMLTAACISEVATASRQLWSFARDNGLPFSSWLSHVPTGRNIPVRAGLVSVVIITSLSLIHIWSNVALNAINSLSVVSLLVSYTVTVGCCIHRRVHDPPLPPRKWSLVRYGFAVNLGALSFVLPLLFSAFWPKGKQVTA